MAGTGGGGLAVGQGVDDLYQRLLSPSLGTYLQLAAARMRLYAVANGILDQGLQQQGRQQCAMRALIELPLDLQALLEAHLFYGQIALGQLDLLRQRGGRVGLGQRITKQIAEIFKHGFGLGRLGTHQSNRAVEGVEQKVGAYAGLKLGQARLGLGRRAAACAQHQGCDQQRRQQATGDGAGQPGHVLQPDERQHGAGVKTRQGAQHASQVLTTHAHALQLMLEAAGRYQPDQRAGQAGAGQQGHGADPAQCVVSAVRAAVATTSCTKARHAAPRRRCRRQTPAPDGRRAWAKRC